MRKKCNTKNGALNIIFLKNLHHAIEIFSYFSKHRLLYTVSCDDSLLAHGTIIHKYTADQMRAFQITLNQKSTESKLVYTWQLCLHLTASVFEGAPLKSQP